MLTQADADILGGGTKAFAGEPNVAAIFLKRRQAFAPGDRLIQPDLAATLKRNRQGRARRLLQGPDRRGDRRGKRGQWRHSRAGRISPTTRSTETRAGALQLPRLRHHLGAAAQLRRHDDLRDPQHPRGYPMTRSGLPLGGRHPCSWSRRCATPMSTATSRSAIPPSSTTRSTSCSPPTTPPRSAPRSIPARPALEGSRCRRCRRTRATETTHYSIIDKDGNAVAVTYTINDYFGAKVIAGDTGFFLNDEMDDFTAKPGARQPLRPGPGQSQRHRAGQAPASAP